MKSASISKNLPLNQTFLFICLAYFGYVIVGEVWPSTARTFYFFNAGVQLLFDFSGIFLCFNISRNGRKADGVPFYFYFFAFVAAIMIDGLRGLEMMTSGITPYGRSFVELFINCSHITFLILCSLALQGVLESAVLRVRRQAMIIQKTPSSQRLHIFIALSYFILMLVMMFDTLIISVTDNTARIIQIILTLSNGLLLGYLVSSVGSLKNVGRVAGDRRISTTQYVSTGFVFIILFGFFSQLIEVSGNRDFGILIQAPWMLGKFLILSGFIQISRASAKETFAAETVA